MDKQIQELLVLALMVVVGLYVIFILSVNFRYVIAGAITYPVFREIDKIYRQYEWMLIASNQEKLIFGASCAGICIISLIFVGYLFLAPMVPWYRESVYKAQSKRVWNPIFLCIIWIVEAVIIHHLAYTSFLTDKEFRFYFQDHYLIYYLSGIGFLLMVSVILHFILWAPNLINFFSLTFESIVDSIIRYKNKLFKVSPSLKYSKTSSNKRNQIEPTIMGNSIPDAESTIVEKIDDRFNSLLDIRDGNYHYRKIKEINRGGFGIVYLVENVKSGTLYAAKCPHISFDADSSSERKRYQREIEAHSTIIHENVVRLVHTCHQEKLVYIIMEYVDGEDLRNAIKNNSIPDLRSRINLMCQILDGLSVIHSHQVIHRDIKPSNILVNSKGIAKITDFGIAKLGDATQITLTGTFMGTPEYMSPEQYRGEKLDLRTDIYSIGLTFYEMLSNRPSPTVGLGRNELYRYKINNSYPPLHQINKKIPKALSIVIHQAFHPVVSMRYSSAKDFKKAILGS